MHQSFVWQCIQDNFRYQDGNVMCHYARVVIVFPQQEGITNMEKQVKSSQCSPIDCV